MSEKIVVLGGGISGLSFAAYCVSAGIPVAVIEKNGALGGSIHTWLYNGQPVELGAHTCYNTYGNTLFLCELFGLDTDIKARKKFPYKIYVHKKIRSIMSQFSIIELLPALKNIISRSSRSGKTVAAYFTSLLGKRNYDRLFHYFMQAVVCQNADAFPAEMVFRKKPRNKKFPRSFSFKSGMARLTSILDAHPLCTIYRNDAAVAIEACPIGYRITTHSGLTIEASRVVSALPPLDAAQLLGALKPELSHVLQTIKSSSVESFAVAVKEESVSLAGVSGIVGIEEPFMSIVSSDPVLSAHSAIRIFTFHFKPQLLSLEEKKLKVAEVLGISLTDIVAEYAHTSKLPALTSDHLQKVAAIDIFLDQTLYCTGNYFIGSSIEDCVQRSRDEFIRLKRVCSL